jgi:predicted amidohydrolase
MSDTALAAVVQMTSRDALDDNLTRARELVLRAARRGAMLIATPENTSFMGPEENKRATAERFTVNARDGGDGPVAKWAGALAREATAWLLVGSAVEASDEPARVYNTSLLYNPAGVLVGLYRKVHLFDVQLADGSSYHESRAVKPGETLVVRETAVGSLGMSVCYDVRFPALYRALVERGANVLSVPAAFTVPTGRDHWHVLLRARAIECQSFVLAPAQWGSHGHGRTTYGHAMIVDPWGTVLAECGDGEGIAMAELDLDRVRQVRAQIPCLQHTRAFRGE